MDKEEVSKFANWMAKMGNMHYYKDEQMSAAFDKITPLKYRDL